MGRTEDEEGWRAKRDKGLERKGKQKLAIKRVPAGDLKEISQFALELRWFDRLGLLSRGPHESI